MVLNERELRREPVVLSRHPKFESDKQLFFYFVPIVYGYER